MIVLGVDFNASIMTWIVADFDDGEHQVLESGDLKLPDTRQPSALTRFQAASAHLLTEWRPELVAVKEKPEKGRMSAGAAALKMEGLLLACVTCRVDIVSGRRVNAGIEYGGDLKEKLKPAFRAALAAFKKSAE